ncbi:MAG: putative bifunctional diguanylate cyclase/phosphodiesterase [Solirubrobacterales bacterium]
MSAAALAHQDMLAALRRAVAEGRLALRYQPKFDLYRRRVTGVEALVRWHDPAWGWISPASFIPLAEDGGLIIPLGAWVLAQACQQGAIWQAMGLSLSVAVNISPLQLTPGARFERIVRRALASSGLEPARLELEVTEGVLMDRHARDTLDRLTACGIAVALDDFGTGYSSLAYMKQLPARTLKIDKSFIDGLPASLSDCMMVDAMIRLAHSFGMMVVAEGVESVEQRDVLELMGCDMIQGFVLAPALPGPEVAGLTGGQADHA